jgi:peptide/nickel transport system substrate-binding protein
MWMWFDVLFENAWTIDDLPGDDTAKCQAVKDAITFDDATGTVTFHLALAYAPFLDLLATPAGAVLDQEWMAVSGGWEGSCADWRAYHDPPAEGSILYDQMNGTGPFRLEQWAAGEVKLVRNDRYWRVYPPWPEGPSGPAALEAVLLKTVPDWETRRDMLLGGEADLAVVPDTDFSDLEPFVWAIYQGSEDREPVLTNPATGTLRLFKSLPVTSQAALLFCYDINPDTNPYIGSGALDGNGIPPDCFADIHVRKAFNYAMG